MRKKSILIFNEPRVKSFMKTQLGTGSTLHSNIRKLFIMQNVDAPQELCKTHSHPAPKHATKFYTVPRSKIALRSLVTKCFF